MIDTESAAESAARSTIAQAIERRCDEGGAAFIPYLCAGDPDLATTAAALRTLERVGADVIELGVPFSDPVADGPTNQRAFERALSAGCTLDRVLSLLRAERDAGLKTPVVLFTYLNPIVRKGYARFAAEAVAAGAQGVLAVDLPVEEAEGAYLQAMRAAALDTIFLAAPTTTSERLKHIARASRGFLYYVSRLGVTGGRAELASGLLEQVGAVRDAAAPLPVAVGFGIQNPQQAAALRGTAHAVVVGSALVSELEQGGPKEGLLRMGRLAESLAACLHARPKHAEYPQNT